MKKVCPVPNCVRPVFAGGRCAACYAWEKDNGRPRPHGKFTVRQKRTICKRDDCSEPVAYGGRCRKHQNEHVRNGLKMCSTDGCTNKTTGRLCTRHLHAELAAAPDAKPCIVDECQRKGVVKGMCEPHYLRTTRGVTGDDLATPFRQYSGKYKRKSDDYVMVYVDGALVLEHRNLGSKWLGRKLIKGESVHHRDGQRNHNTIGPCFTANECRCDGDTRHNLEFWSKSQPAGQRVADKMKWVWEMVGQYEALFPRPTP